MEHLGIHLDGARSAFQPGERIRGSVQWSVEEPGSQVELRLFWYTQGIGTRDVGVAHIERFETTGSQGSGSFDLEAPEGPYSFEGKLVSVVWALELVVPASQAAERVELVIGPDAHEVKL